MAELYPILVHCRTIVYRKTMLSFFTYRCRQPIRIVYYVTRKPRDLSTRVPVPMLYDRLEQVDWNKLVLTLTEEIIIQSEPEKQDKNQISEKNFYYVSASELKILQRVRF